VYVASENQIWKHQIIDANGTLSAAEEVYSFTVTGEEILSFAISNAGNMYIGCDSLSATSKALYKVEPSGGSYIGQPANPIYPSALSAPSGYICWGNDDYIYINRTNTAPSLRRIIRLICGRRTNYSLEKIKTKCILIQMKKVGLINKQKEKTMKKTLLPLLCILLVTAAFGGWNYQQTLDTGRGPHGCVVGSRW
jgi:hypothetical protein